MILLIHTYGGATLSNLLNSSCLTLRFSKIASTTRSVSLTAFSASVCILILDIVVLTKSAASYGNIKKKKKKKKKAGKQ